MSPEQRDANQLRRGRMEELRRHALAIATLIEGSDAEDLEVFRPGDVVQILEGHQHAHTLLRVVKVDGDNCLHGYLLAASRRHRTGGYLCRIGPNTVQRVGNASEAIAIDSYPLPERPGHTLAEYAEISRKIWIEQDEAKKARRNAAAKLRRRRVPTENGNLTFSEASES